MERTGHNRVNLEAAAEVERIVESGETETRLLHDVLSVEFYCISGRAVAVEGKLHLDFAVGRGKRLAALMRTASERHGGNGKPAQC